ncbi:MAG: tRNA (adenosine(37)-N6)-threonylcarbamoyltransferase complex ATPase subunit type 1 TsaE [Ignavibacteria bacterium]|nr:tRNA (adenosine(37)-N6)-threonylcarbamoyltransferase complex ATPase subunit type 1 TsaE [Ignavibacteria bacterium]
MQRKTFTTHSEEATIALGEEFARELARGSIVALYGDIGTGKTRLIKGICRGLGVEEHVASPTFTIVTEYKGSFVDIYHFDFYRMKSPTEVREIGVEEYLGGDGVCLIEWADRIKDILPLHRFEVHLSLGEDERSRVITIEDHIGVAA